MADVSVEEFTKGDRAVLLTGQEVVIESTRLLDGRVSVRWRGRTKHPKGHRLAGEHVDLGTFKPAAVGDTISIQELIKR